MTLTRPFGAPAFSHRMPTTIDDSGVSSEGLIITPLPAQIAGATCQQQVKSGAFHGVIWLTTPSGS